VLSRVFSCLLVLSSVFSYFLVSSCAFSCLFVFCRVFSCFLVSSRTFSSLLVLSRISFCELTTQYLRQWWWRNWQWQSCGMCARWFHKTQILTFRRNLFIFRVKFGSCTLFRNTDKFIPREALTHHKRRLHCFKDGLPNTSNFTPCPAGYTQKLTCLLTASSLHVKRVWTPTLLLHSLPLGN